MPWVVTRYRSNSVYSFTKAKSSSEPTLFHMPLVSKPHIHQSLTTQTPPAERNKPWLKSSCLLLCPQPCQTGQVMFLPDLPDSDSAICNFKAGPLVASDISGPVLCRDCAAIVKEKQKLQKLTNSRSCWIVEEPRKGGEARRDKESSAGWDLSGQEWLINDQSQLLVRSEVGCGGVSRKNWRTALNLVIGIFLITTTTTTTTATSIIIIELFFFFFFFVFFLLLLLLLLHWASLFFFSCFPCWTRFAILQCQGVPLKMFFRCPGVYWLCFVAAAAKKCWVLESACGCFCGKNCRNPQKTGISACSNSFPN